MDGKSYLIWKRTGGMFSLRGIKLGPHFQIVAFTVDKDYIQEETLFDLPVVPFENIETKNPSSDNTMLVSLGYKQAKHL